MKMKSVPSFHPRKSAIQTVLKVRGYLLKRVFVVYRLGTIGRHAEIDYVEKIDGKVYAYEFEWNPLAKIKFPAAFVEKYQPTETKIIHPENFWQWLNEYPY